MCFYYSWVCVNTWQIGLLLNVLWCVISFVTLGLCVHSKITLHFIVFLEWNKLVHVWIQSTIGVTSYLCLCVQCSSAALCACSHSRYKARVRGEGQVTNNWRWKGRYLRWEWPILAAAMPDKHVHVWGYKTFFILWVPTSACDWSVKSIVAKEFDH